MLGRRVKAGVIVAALLVLAVEGVLLIRYYDRYYGSDTAPGSAPSSAPTLEGTILEETTATDDEVEGTSIGGADGAQGTDDEAQGPNLERPTGPAEEASFVHRATDGNSRGDYTYLSHPTVDGDPNAVVLVEPAPDLGSAGDAAYAHNIGVWYEPGAKEWAIFNQDRAAMPAGTAFRVVVPRESEGFVERLASAPAGANDHPVGLDYDTERDRWLVYNTDLAPIKEGTAFNVGVS